MLVIIIVDVFEVFVIVSDFIYLFLFDIMRFVWGLGFFVGLIEGFSCVLVG